MQSLRLAEVLINLSIDELACGLEDSTIKVLNFSCDVVVQILFELSHHGLQSFFGLLCFLAIAERQRLLDEFVHSLVLAGKVAVYLIDCVIEL